ncbi:MAG: hypothetical protein M3268_04960, partial [Acidobacteriota bacterium]|nr:hypothetical protein [Acidobacteriota bacterium]
NTLWDKERRLLDISNARAADEFARILLAGVAARARDANDGAGMQARATSARRARKDKDKGAKRKQAAK